MSATTVPFPAQSRMFGKHFEYSRYPDVLAAIHGMLAGLPDGQACVLSTLEGHHLAHSAAPMLDSTRLAAVASSLCGMAQTLARDLSQQGLVEVTVRTDNGFALVQRLPVMVAPRMEPSPSARSIAANLARLEQSEPELLDAVVGNRLSSPARVQTVAFQPSELSTMQSTASKRRFHRPRPASSSNGPISAR